MSADKPRPAAAIRASVAEVRNDIGPPIQRYVIPLGNPRLFAWTLGNTDADDGWTTIAHSGGTAGRWKRVAAPDQGDDLTNTDATITVAGGPWRVLPAATLSANRTNTVDVTGAVEGDTLEFTRLDTTAHTVTWVNGGPAAGTLATMPVSARSRVLFYFNGTNWVHRASGLML
jgi:hypothetical protein